MLEQEQTFYEAHRKELRARYAGKCIVIVKDSILGVYDSDGEAYEETVKTREGGTFMIKYIPEDPAEEELYIAPIIQPVVYG